MNTIIKIALKYGVSMFLLACVLLIGLSQSSVAQTPIKTGISFQFSDTQANNNNPATLQSVTINADVLSAFIVPTGYEMTFKKSPNIHNIQENGSLVINNSNSPLWDSKALDAFQDKNLNHYFEAANSSGFNANGSRPGNSATTRQTLFYAGGVPVSSDGYIVITERGGNNDFFMVARDSDGVELGTIYVWRGGAGPDGGSYVSTGRNNDNGQSIEAAVFDLNDIAAPGTEIADIEMMCASADCGDGKVFLISMVQPINATDDEAGPVNGIIGAVDVINVLDNDGFGGGHANLGNVSLTEITPDPTSSLTLNADGSVDVAPGTAPGVYNLTYEICDLSDATNCDDAEVTITVSPIAEDDSFNAIFETPYNDDVSTNDTFPVGSTFALVNPGTEPSDGTIMFNANGTFTYTPNMGFSGSDSFDYEVCLPAPHTDVCDTATADITVPALVAPTANDDSDTTDANTPVDVDILDNDVEGSAPLDAASVSFVPGSEPNPATEGVFSYDPVSELVTFTPVLGYVGFASIDYEVCDTNALCDTATITIEVLMPFAPVSNFFPAGGFGTLAFEDLWPAQGDYDFNDLVIDYQFEVISNMNNFIEEVTGTFVIQAFGASYQNGFGFQLSQAVDANDLTVSGYSISESYINLNPNGTEAGQARPTIIVFDNAYNEMPHPGGGAIGINTETSAPYVSPVTITVTIEFPANTYTWNQLNIANFNPFLIVDLDRGREVHLPNYMPTSLADPSFFGQEDDATNISQNETYVNEDNLPWAINIYEKFDYPIEKQDIVWVHLKFVEWAESGGSVFPNWYQNQPGFRNQALIYVQP